jgi:hypothetical protein
MYEQYSLKDLKKIQEELTKEIERRELQLLLNRAEKFKLETFKNFHYDGLISSLRFLREKSGFQLLEAKKVLDHWRETEWV